MMIWDLIRDFYVQYIFGGYDSALNPYQVSWGYDWSTDTPYNSNEYFYKLDGFTYSTNVDVDFSYISVGDWLSTTATLITMIAFVIGIIAFMVWLFRLVGNLIMLRN